MKNPEFVSLNHKLPSWSSRFAAAKYVLVAESVAAVVDEDSKLVISIRTRLVRKRNESNYAYVYLETSCTY